MDSFLITSNLEEENQQLTTLLTQERKAFDAAFAANPCDDAFQTLLDYLRNCSIDNSGSMLRVYELALTARKYQFEREELLKSLRNQVDHQRHRITKLEDELNAATRN